MRCIRLAEWTGTLRRTIGFQPTRARQARLFFVYPSVVAGAGVASYVSFTRVLASVTGARPEITPLPELGNLVVDVPRRGAGQKPDALVRCGA